MEVKRTNINSCRGPCSQCPLFRSANCPIDNYEALDRRLSDNWPGLKLTPGKVKGKI